ncbi:MAG: T9SS type A sorting domain-containing protein [Bacteroidetes bacterium]|nr:T9SS type A sorting domain-containing protein [Bacteroidota bacterium]
MRNLKVLLIFILFICHENLFSQVEWQLLNPRPFAVSNNSVYFININTGWIAGANGKILKTTNAGFNWAISDAGAIFDIYSIYFANDLTGWVCGTGGKVLKSTNGGDNWTSENSGLTVDLYSIKFRDANTGAICGVNNNYSITTNGGTNWIVQNSLTAGTPTYYIKYFDNFSGIMIGDNFVAKTLNGGVNWSTIPNNMGVATSIYFLDSLLGWYFNGGIPNALVKTTNGGTNWNIICEIPGVKINSLYFRDSLQGCAFSSENLFYKTTNGGVNWTSAAQSYGQMVNTAMFFNDSLNGYCVSNRGSILKTNNWGANWINYITNPTPENNIALDFINSNTGWSGGNNILKKTTNSGNNWIISTLPQGVKIFTIEALSNDTILIGGYAPNGISSGAVVYKSTNGGINFSERMQLLGGGISDFCFINSQTGWATCEYANRSYKTVNGGLDWVEFAQYGSKSTFFINQNTGWLLTDVIPVKLQATTNGGTNWTIYTTPTTNGKLRFINATTGVFLGSYLFKTTNSGANWRTINNISNVSSLQFVNDSIAWCVSGSNILYSTNCCETWSIAASSNGIPLTKINFINSNSGWVTGEAGIVLRTTNGGNVFISSVSSEIPDNYSLSQNYPNPFNPSTKINYEIKSSGFVTLKVFDLLGKEVATLVDEKQNAGSYAVDFNSSEFNLRSGIYFYTLNAGEFKETRKMVLIK